MSWLRERTRDAHESIERVVPLMRSDVTRVDYANYLAGMLGFHRVIEPAIGRIDEFRRLLPDWPVRTKTALLERDLRALGRSERDVAAIPSPTRVPRVDDVADAFGACYVLEGATLGGRVIVRHLREALQLVPGEETAFFECYGSEHGARWTAFRTALEDFAGDDESRRARIADKASDVFRQLELWLATPRTP